MEISKQDLENIIRIAFERGEEWGVCYSTWFTPSDEQKEERIQEALTELMR